MAPAMLIMSKQISRLDPSLRQKAFTFLQKLTTDDSTSGLHIEPVKGAADQRVRTGRVDQKHRAVMFKVHGGDQLYYFLQGIWNHEEAYRIACTSVLRVNPVNGVTEIVEASQPAADEDSVRDTSPTIPGAGNLTSVSSSPAGAHAALPTRPAGSHPLVTADVQDLVGKLGVDRVVAERVVTLTDDTQLLDLVEALPPWQEEALLALATGSSIDEVCADLDLAPTSTPAVTAAGPSASEDAKEPSPSAAPPEPPVAAPTLPTEPTRSAEELIKSLDLFASQMEFAKIEGSEELRRVIENGDFGAWRVFLHPLQRRWAKKHWNGSFRLAGGAGTGKTVVVLHRARHLALADPGARIIVTTFTRNLADELVAGLRRLDPRLVMADHLGAPGIFVSGIDALASAVLQNAGGEVASASLKTLGDTRTDMRRRSDPTMWRQAITDAPNLPPTLASPNFLASEYGLVIIPNGLTRREDYLRARRPGRGVRLNRASRNAVWDAVDRYREAGHVGDSVDWDEASAIAARCLDDAAARTGQLLGQVSHGTNRSSGRLSDHVLVDEGQDLSPAHWLLVRSLVDEGPDDIFIAEDAHQRIYAHRLVLSHFGINTRGRSRRLTLNYRTTEQNLRWATSVLEGGRYVDLDDQDDTTAGYRSARRGPKPVIRQCASLTDELDFTADTIRRWVEASSERSESLAILVRDRRGRDRVVNGLRERGVEVRGVDRELARTDVPVVMTMHRAKGMEFTRVILFEVSRSAIPVGLRQYDYSPDDKQEALLRERSLLYVAASRARDELVISWAGAPSPLLDGIDTGAGRH